MRFAFNISFREDGKCNRNNVVYS